MTHQDFFSTKSLEDSIINRKVTMDALDKIRKVETPRHSNMTLTKIQNLMPLI